MMRIKPSLALILFLIINLKCLGNDFYNGLVNENIAVYYPSNFDSSLNLPSFALQNEFPIIDKNITDSFIKPVFYNSGNKAVASISFNKGTSLYGTGEVTGSLLRNGKTITCWNTDNYMFGKFEGKQLYQSHLWVLGVNTDGSAFGVLADNTWKQDIELTDSIRFISDGPAFRIFVIKGRNPQEVLKSLAKLTGTIELPPLWALGFQQCKYSYYPDTRVEKIARTYVEKQIPCDVIWVDIDYMNKFKIFTFDSSRFPNPKKLNTTIRSLGMRSVWMIDPGVKIENGYFVYDQGTAADLWVKDKDGKAYVGDVWPGPCVFPDFTMPQTQKWWSSLYTDFLKNEMDGVWNDMNEPSVFNGPGGSMPIDNLHQGGGSLVKGPHLRYHNVYAYLMVKASKEGIKAARPEKRPFVLSRAGFVGSQRYCATWTGDNGSDFSYLKTSIPMSLNLSLSGQPFNGSDIGGYTGRQSDTLHGQWFALGAFYPFSRAHSDNSSGDEEPWAYGPAIEKVAKTAIMRRYALLPYLYTLFHEASETGLPVMRPVFFADPQDLSLRSEEQAFLLGENLLIVPKWAKSPALPKGVWTNVSLAGENSSDDYFQADVKIKEGSIVPLAKVVQNTSFYKNDSLTLLVSLDKSGEARGTMYDDSGEGYDYQKGDFSVSTFEARLKSNELIVTIEKTKGKRSIENRYYLLKLVLGEKVIEGKWSKGNRIVFKIK